MGGLQTLDLALFFLGTFAAAFVTGLAGFAFGIVAAAVWLHFLPPAEAAALIVAFGLIVQGVSVWKLRAAVKLGRILPFVLGSAIGVPLGAELLRWAPAATIRMTVGGLLVPFRSTTGSARTRRQQVAPAPWPMARSASLTA